MNRINFTIFYPVLTPEGGKDRPKYLSEQVQNCKKEKAPSELISGLNPISAYPSLSGVNFHLLRGFFAP